MFLIDYTDHRVVAIIVALSIAFLSVLIILIRYIIRAKKK